MRCVNCAGQFIAKKGNLNLSDKVLGDFVVKNTEWDQCEKCGEILYSPTTMRDIERAEEDRKTELLLNKPLKAFILGSEVADILECSRQAVHKHKRIRRGFVHFVKYNNNIYYLRESVELYKETGDGRIQLSAPKYKEPQKVISFRKPFERKNRGTKSGYAVDAGSDTLSATETGKFRNIGFEELMEG